MGLARGVQRVTVQKKTRDKIPNKHYIKSYLQWLKYKTAKYCQLKSQLNFDFRFREIVKKF